MIHTHTHVCVCVVCAVLSLSVMSDSLQPHKLQHVRFPCPWGFSRQEYWTGLPCPPPGDLPNPGIILSSPALQAGLYCLSHQGSPYMCVCVCVCGVCTLDVIFHRILNIVLCAIQCYTHFLRLNLMAVVIHISYFGIWLAEKLVGFHQWHSNFEPVLSR